MIMHVLAVQRVKFLISLSQDSAHLPASCWLPWLVCADASAQPSVWPTAQPRVNQHQ